MLHRAFIHTVSPLTVVMPSTTVAIPAVKLTGLSYTPVVGDAVLVDLIAGSRQIVVLGKAA